MLRAQSFKLGILDNFRKNQGPHSIRRPQLLAITSLQVADYAALFHDKKSIINFPLRTTAKAYSCKAEA